MGRQRLTETERKTRKAERYKKWSELHKEDRAEYLKQWRKENPEYKKQYNKTHKEEITEYYKQWNELHKEDRAEYKKQYFNTPLGRAHQLVGGYKQSDKKYNRGECTLTAQWLVDNILFKPCSYCGITGWDVIGCNRLDNSLPHTENNVEPCCALCNCRLPKK